MKKLEAKFTSYFKNQMKIQYPKVHWHKIQDSYIGRFLMPKPYDAFMLLKRHHISIEFKYNDKPTALNLNDLRPSQHDGLQETVDNGGLALVIYEMKMSRGQYVVVTLTYNEFKALKSVHVKNLREVGRAVGIKTLYSVKAHEYNFVGFFNDLEFELACL